MTFKKILGTSLLLFAGGVSGVSAGEFSRYAIADVSQGQGNQPKEMPVSDLQHAFIKFSIANILGGVTSAKLRVYAAPGSYPIVNGVSYKARLIGGNGDGWTDDDLSTVNFSNGDLKTEWLAPVSGGNEQDSDGVIRKFIEFDLLQHAGHSQFGSIIGNGLVTVEIKNTLTNQVNLMASSEVSDYKYHPKFVLNNSNVLNQNKTLVAFQEIPQFHPETGKEVAPRDYKFRMSVGMTHDSYEDPILHPGKRDATHHHMFVGNGYVNRDSIPATLRAETGTAKLWTKGMGANRSGYWVPVMYDQRNKPVPLGFHQIYYTRGAGEETYSNIWQNGGPNTGRVMPLPEGLTMVTKRGDHRAYKFACMGHNSLTRVINLPVYTGSEQQVQYTIPNCTGNTNFLLMKILFPDCWDGTHKTDADADDAAGGSDGHPHSHMRYRDGAGVCPTGFKVQLPQIIYLFGYPIQGVGSQDPQNYTFSRDDTSQYYLSSDPEDHCGKDDFLPHGCSAHGDWMNGWESTVMKEMVGRDESGTKVNPATSCVGSLKSHCTEGQIKYQLGLESIPGSANNFTGHNKTRGFDNHTVTAP